MPQRGQVRVEPGLRDLGRRAARGAERVAAVPVDQRRGVGDEPALVLRQHGGRLAQADRPRPLRGRRPLRAAAARQAAGHERGRSLAAGRRGVDVDREQGSGVVDPEQVRLAARVAERDDREPVAVEHDPFGPAQHGPRGGVAALPVDPGRVAAALVARPVEPRAGERVRRAHANAGMTSDANSSSWASSRCSRCWSITRSTPASS